MRSSVNLGVRRNLLCDDILLGSTTIFNLNFHSISCGNSYHQSMHPPKGSVTFTNKQRASRSEEQAKGTAINTIYANHGWL